MKLLRLPGRFEWKILIALFVVASLPLGAAAYLMSVTIGRIEAITEQHQEAIRQSLGGAVDVYKAYFEQMKDGFRERAAEIGRTRSSTPTNWPRCRICCGRASCPGRASSRSGRRPPTSSPKRARRRRAWWRCPAQGAAGRAAAAGADVRDPKEIYANFLALRSAMEQERELDRLLPVVLPKIFHGLGVALVGVLAVAAAWVSSSPGARPAAWPR